MIQSFFHHVALFPPDPILSLPLKYKKDLNPQKVDLGVGAYRDAEGRPYVLQTVAEAEKRLLLQTASKEYLPIDGDPTFVKSVQDLVLGHQDDSLIYSAQTVGATAALRVAGQFLASNLTPVIYLSRPTWPTHHLIFRDCGFEVREYPYYDKETNTLDFTGMCQELKNAPKHSIVLLQGCCHNPTGLDLSIEQWKEVSEVIRSCQLFPFFDFSYQGFGRGLEEDAQAIRYFLEQHHEMFIAVSLAKNFGLYGERVGALIVCLNDKAALENSKSQLKQMIRATYSNPPIHGASLVKMILSDTTLAADWKAELKAMRERLEQMRFTLQDGLAICCQNDFAFYRQQKGMFSFGGLTESQVEELEKKFSIYLLKNSRISICGLNPHNIDYVIQSFASVIK